MQKVLIIEDEPDMVLGLQDNFEYEGYEVIVARDGKAGMARALADKPDLILLDIMLPRMSGLDVCRHLRRNGVEAPVIMLTARGQEIDKIIGLEVGADDYVTKPFSIKELLARVRAHLRRASKQVAEIETYRLGDIELNFKHYQAAKEGKPLEMSPREFEILKYFIQHKGEAITRERLLDDVWGYDCFPITRTVDNHIAKLRQKIEPVPAEPQYIITIHRVGYKFLG
ncbi:MAG: response regulator transcription factor [Blastocatellia bacterium]|nr:response regulator transcription factor [Blastocatellia bacterium]